MSGLDTSGWTKQDWLLQRYKYEPSEPAAIAFAAAFGLTTVVHLLQLLRSKTWYFIPFFVGGLCKCTRVSSASQLRSGGETNLPFLISRSGRLRPPRHGCHPG
jgi:hypothetical protein